MKFPSMLATFIIALIVVMVMFAVFDFIVAGILFLIVSIFERNEAFIVFKWVLNGLFFIEAVFTPPLLYNTVIKRKD